MLKTHNSGFRTQGIQYRLIDQLKEILIIITDHISTTGFNLIVIEKLRLRYIDLFRYATDFHCPYLVFNHIVAQVIGKKSHCLTNIVCGHKPIFAMI